MPFWSSLLIVALVVALAQIERKGVLQAMLSRPIVVGSALGALLGDVSCGLMLGAVLELLWMSGINVGANLPDNEVVGTGTIIGAASIAGCPEVLQFEVSTLAMVLLAPTAILGRKVDAIIEKKNIAIINRTFVRLKEGKTSGGLNLFGLLAPIAAAASLASISAGIGAYALGWMLKNLPRFALDGLSMAFPMIVVALGALAIANTRTEKASVSALIFAMIGLTVLILSEFTGAFFNAK